MQAEINIDELRERYGNIAASEFVIHKTGPIHYAGGRCGDHDAGRYELFAALCAAPKIILSLCNIITCDNEELIKKDKIIERMISTHDIAEARLLRKVAKSGKSK